MTDVTQKKTAAAHMLRCGASKMVIGAALLTLVPGTAFAQAQEQAGDQLAQAEDTATPTSAQTDPNAGTNPETQVAGEGDADDSAIIVTGQRRALQTSQGIKRNADTVVDSITATDIGAFPDKSVAEALQRVPGITVNRFAASSDTAHFSAEPSGVIVRGLPQVRSEFNGRDTFSANSSRGLSWGDITPELMAGVDTYKNQTAEMIEGGIAGSINLRTRVPFDAQGQLIQFAVNANYGDLSKELTPDANAFYSNRWSTGIGEFGIMGNIAYSHVKTRSQGIQYARTGIFDRGLFPGSADPAGCGPQSVGTAGCTVYVPSGIAFRDNEYDRKRLGIAAAAQWRSNDRKWLVTAQFNRSTYKSEWQERAFNASFFDLYGSDVRFRYAPGGAALNEIPVGAPGAPEFTFDSEGNLVNGTFNRGHDVTWWGNPAGTPSWGGSFGEYSAPGYGVNDQGQPMFNTCYEWSTPNGGITRPGGPACTSTRYGDDVGTASRFNSNKNMTQDAAINIKWEATDRLRFNFDGQYVDSQIDNYDIEIDMNSFATVALDATGRPRVDLQDPTNINQSAGGLSNPNNWYVRSVMDHLEDSEGHQWALRGDGEFDIGSDWLETVKFGARWADRKQTVQWSTYNWHNVANTWTTYRNTTVRDPQGRACTNPNSTVPCPVAPHPFFNLTSQPTNIGTVNFRGYPSGFYEVSPFGTGFHGGTIGDFPFVPFEFLRDHRADEFSASRIGVGSFIPVCKRNGQATPGGDVLPVELPNSCFAPDEVADVGEETRAVYAMLRFGGPNAQIGGLGISGNIGLRYIETRNESNGFLRYPALQADATKCPATPLVPGGLTGTGTPPPPPPPPPPGAPTPPPVAPFPSYCYLTGEDVAFAAAGPGEARSAQATHRHLLPSFNLRVDLSDKWLVRFAASKAMSRPDIGLLKNFVQISQSLPNGSDLSDPRWKLNAAGMPIGVTPFYNASAYNPYLKPTTAWQFDLTLENYFANVGSFTAALFYKKFSNYIQYGAFNLDVTRGSVTRTVEVRGPANGGGAEIRGFEVAYQRFFDFLPEPLNGLGIQANYTFVDNKGVPNSNLSPVGGTGGGTTNAGNAGTALTPGTLEGLSKHSFNLVGMYEKGPIAARLAYNWRSKYLVTAVDCCVYLPVWQTSAGFLDGSIRFKVNDNIELSVQGSNLLNTKTKLLQQVTDEESPEGRNVLTPNAWFQNDRRFTAGVRFRF
jgi:outer membrane receptor protein involved in Fe transport